MNPYNYKQFRFLVHSASVTGELGDKGQDKPYIQSLSNIHILRENCSNIITRSSMRRFRTQS